MTLAERFKKMYDKVGVAHKEEIEEGLTEIWGLSYVMFMEGYKLEDIKYDDSVSDETKLGVWIEVSNANLDVTKLNMRYVTKMVRGKLLTFNEATLLLVYIMEDAYNAAEEDYEKMKEK